AQADIPPAHAVIPPAHAAIPPRRCTKRVPNRLGLLQLRSLRQKGILPQSASEGAARQEPAAEHWAAVLPAVPVPPPQSRGVLVARFVGQDCLLPAHVPCDCRARGGWLTGAQKTTRAEGRREPRTVMPRRPVPVPAPWRLPSRRSPREAAP